MPLGYLAGYEEGRKVGVNADLVFRTCDSLVRRIDKLESQLRNEAALEPVTEYKEESDALCHELGALVIAARNGVEATSSQESL